MRFIRAHKGRQHNMLIGLSKTEEKSFTRSVICIQEQGQIYKLLSFETDKKDGSIYIFFNYCNTKEAFVFCHKHTYKAGEGIVAKEDVTLEYNVDSTSKLSLHSSGFIQLSGTGILSGIDKKTGKAKGVGIFSRPPEKPVTTGPTLSFTFWGVSKGFELLNRKKDKYQYIILEKENNDFFVEEVIKNDKKVNTYCLQFFIFPKEANNYVYEYKGMPYIERVMVDYTPKPDLLFAQPVLDLKYFNGVISVFPQLIWTPLSDNASFGYTLNSPGGSDSSNFISDRKSMFHLFCPRINKQSQINNIEYKIK